MQYQAFCDTSGVFDRRYQAIGVVSGPFDNAQVLRDDLNRTISEYDIRELKFIDVTRVEGRDFRAAREAIMCVVARYCRYGRIRVDIMTWDTADSRHSVPGRSDTENLGRLYYHLLLKTITRWPPGEWSITLDKNEQIDYETLRGCINSFAVSPRTTPRIIFSTRELEEFNTIHVIQEMESHEEAMIQLADLFAGMARYSHEEGETCCGWLEVNQQPEQLPFPELSDGMMVKCSRTQECRYQLIGELCRTCRRYRLGVSLRTKKYLWTPNPQNPINFWHYTPQGDYDRAPTG
jgi:hypothetical protein